MRAGVVGHVEWARFAQVERLPEQAEIIEASETWAEAAGGGAVAAGQLLKLAGAVDFFVAIGNDELGGRVRSALEEMGMCVHAATRDEPQRRVFTHVDADGERTITTLGDKLRAHAADPLPWSELSSIDVVYFSAGDVEALRAARQARVLVATARELGTLAGSGVQLDALVRSGRDPSEGYEPGLLDPEPRLVVSTMGRDGGTYVAGDRSGSWDAADPPGPIVNAYGAGDSFAAGLAFALARGDDTDDALAFAARCGAAAMTGRGAYDGQLRLDR
ncbi:MAG: PfkB family carbohydrate kinase [Actinomycetota bacterium]